MNCIGSLIVLGFGDTSASRPLCVLAISGLFAQKYRRVPARSESLAAARDTRYRRIHAQQSERGELVKTLPLNYPTHFPIRIERAYTGAVWVVCGVRRLTT